MNPPVDPEKKRRKRLLKLRRKIFKDIQTLSAGLAIGSFAIGILGGLPDTAAITFRITTSSIAVVIFVAIAMLSSYVIHKEDDE